MHNVLVRAPRFARQVLPTGTESASGHSRRFHRAQLTSGLSQHADIIADFRHVCVAFGEDDSLARRRQGAI
jgi:hypothetical protein